VKLDFDVVGVDGTRSTSAAPAPRVELYGPGDIIGIDVQRSDTELSGAVSRLEPRDGVTNFEPNYLACIEFLDEDFPWRYTPAPGTAGGARLAPWLALVVLKDDDECRLHRKEAEQPLDFITIENDGGRAFPNPDTMWAWAHVHVNASLTGSAVVATNAASVAAALDAGVTANPDSAYSRIVCPRRLEPDTTYRACLVPAFESGRLAGLGLPLDTVTSAVQPAWPVAGPQNGTSFPVYITWTFRTGVIGDFEYLARLLRPRTVHSSVGVRPIDVSAPHAVLAGVDGATGGVLALGGALRAPRRLMSPEDRAAAEAQDRWATPYPVPFQRDLASLINLADRYGIETSAQANADLPAVSAVAGDDPVITPPLYGRWHALTDRLLSGRTGAPAPHIRNWVHELNLDPRFRVAAGLGVRVIQDRQEDFMNAAWAQVGQVLESNRRMRLMKVAQHVAYIVRRKVIGAIAEANPARMLMLTAPLHSRVMAVRGEGAMTLRAQTAASAVTATLFSGPLRRIARPRGRIARAVNLPGQGGMGALIDRIDRGELPLVPTKVTPAGAPTIAALSNRAASAIAPPWLLQLLVTSPWLVPMVAVFAFLLALILWFAGLGTIAVALLLVGAATGLWLRQRQQRLAGARGMREENQTPAAIAGLRRSPDFTIAAAKDSPGITLRATGADSPEAQRFKSGLADAAALLQATVAADAIGENGPGRAPLEIANAAAITMAAIDPAHTFPRRATAVVRVPERFRQEMVEDGIVEAMAYPIFDTPMFRPLSELSAEFLVPNINKVDNNSVTLLETNQPFIEAYMVGLNHEFGRELLWREYPTDQRGSYFRQFWEVSTAGAETQQQLDALKERLRDIPPLDQWRLHSRLGDHDHRAGNHEDLVLVIRGELLKRYPGAVIYAHAAAWQLDEAGRPDATRPRVLAALSAQEEDDPPSSKLRLPLFSAKLEPDISFLGFDLTEDAARGSDSASGSAGWFFVIKERPGEPRFGFDDSSSQPLAVWSDLGWDLALAPGEICMTPGRAQPLSVAAGQVPGDRQDQHDEDVAIIWNQDVSAADLAYILFQPPVRIAIHAREMLGGGA
jgi:hypothetical protein